MFEGFENLGQLFHRGGDIHVQLAEPVRPNDHSAACVGSRTLGDTIHRIVRAFRLGRTNVLRCLRHQQAIIRGGILAEHFVGQLQNDFIGVRLCQTALIAGHVQEVRPVTGCNHQIKVRCIAHGNLRNRNNVQVNAKGFFHVVNQKMVVIAVGKNIGLVAGDGRPEGNCLTLLAQGIGDRVRRLLQCALFRRGGFLGLGGSGSRRFRGRYGSCLL